MFNVDSSEGLKFFRRIRLGLNHLADHKFRYNFQDCVNPVYSCSQEIETPTHFLLHCSSFRCARQTVFRKIIKIDSTVLKQVITKLLLFIIEKLKAVQNKSILTSTIRFLQATERFKTLIKSPMEWYL